MLNYKTNKIFRLCFFIGSDTLFETVSRTQQDLDVSIHAPARGATCKDTDATARFKVSIHAPARGATFLTVPIVGKLVLFQSTHPQGVRPFEPQGSCSLERFNPRTRKGCDVQQGEQLATLPVSIHAPARGATGGSINLNPAIIVSIHAPARGATHNPTPSESHNLFQSTHPQGVRR